MARAAVADCLARGVVPILVGGSALYVRAVVDAFEFPGTDPELRARLEAELAEVGPGGAARPARRPGPCGGRPDRAGQRPPRRPRARGRRADGTPVRRRAARSVATRCPTSCRSAWTSRARCSTSGSARRVDVMWEAGLVDEVRLLERAGSARRGDRVARARLPAGPRSSSTARSTRPRPGRRRSSAPVGSRGARTAGSARTSASPGSTTTARTWSRRRWWSRADRRGAGT